MDAELRQITTNIGIVKPLAAEELAQQNSADAKLKRKREVTQKNLADGLTRLRGLSGSEKQKARDASLGACLFTVCFEYLG